MATQEGVVSFTPSKRGEPSQAAAARFALTNNEIFINERRRAGDNVKELEAEQQVLCARYRMRYGGEVTRTVMDVADTDETKSNPLPQTD